MCGVNHVLPTLAEGESSNIVTRGSTPEQALVTVCASITFPIPSLASPNLTRIHALSLCFAVFDSALNCEVVLGSAPMAAIWICGTSSHNIV